jgi:hypothetical protein
MEERQARLELARQTDRILQSLLRILTKTLGVSC